MILGDRSLYELCIDDFRALIDKKVSEGPHLDYKLTAYSGRAPDIREMLRDVTSLANAGGGYLVMGIREDGWNRPQEICPIDDFLTKTQGIRQACLDGIQERVDGLQVMGYEIEPNRGIIVIRIPNSEKAPHMVSMDHHSDFYRRYDTDKRVMTIGEIRDSFIDSPFFRRLADIQLQIQESTGQAETATYLQLLVERSVERFLQRYMSTSGHQVLLIISPFVGNLEGESYELADIIKKTWSEKGRVYVITREPQSEYHKEGLAVLEQSENVEIRYNPDINAKLYISWNRNEEESFAMFGSGNLASSGMSYNLELGMMILSRSYGRKFSDEDARKHIDLLQEHQAAGINVIILKPDLVRNEFFVFDDRIYLYYDRDENDKVLAENIILDRDEVNRAIIEFERLASHPHVKTIEDIL
jgi:hypothetical protein